MSIATEEAEKKYPEPTDADDPMYKYVEATAGYPAVKRQGYVAGRTADLTDAEVKAALTELDRHGHYSVFDQIVCVCGAKCTDRHGYRVHRARAMLEEARKVVME